MPGFFVSMKPDQRSAEAGAYRRLYKTSLWQRTRKAQLQREPLCQRCRIKDRLTPATVCHHVDPKTKLDEATFFAGPFQSLCAPCHDGDAQQQEKRGFSTEVGADGWPTDERHPANRCSSSQVR